MGSAGSPCSLGSRQLPRLCMCAVVGTIDPPLPGPQDRHVLGARTQLGASPADACGPKPLLRPIKQELEAVLFDVSGPSLAGPTSTSAAGAASAQQQAAPQGVPAPAPGAVCIGSPLLWPVAPADIRDVSSGILEGLPGLELYVTRRAPVYAAHSGFLTSEEFVGE